MKQKIEELFYSIVDQYPEQIAIEYGDQSITYRELDIRSNRVASALQDRGIGNGSYIGIFTENRMELICLILGVIKSGNAFVPFDSNYPSQRIQNMIEDVDFELFLISEVYKNMIEEIYSGEKDKLTLIQEVLAPELSERRLELLNRLDDNLYVYFTSGSTGKPKGIVGRYKGLLHFINWEKDTFKIEVGDRFTQFASTGFDAFLKDTLIPLCCGATVCIPKDRQVILHGAQLVEWIEENRITACQTVPSIFKLIASSIKNSEQLKSLRFITLAGEPIRPRYLEDWYKFMDERVQIVNLYGPTETTLTKTFYFIKKADLNKRSISIGQPMLGSQVIIFDEKMNICEEGVIGDIYIRTPYRSLGYLDPELTKKKFIVNPYNNDPNDLLYKTGDLGRYQFDGNLEFIGRKDHQVKIRGVRIELGDIESQLLHHPEIKEAIVLDQEDSEGDKFLAAYVISRSDISVVKLRKYLGQFLPEFMIPSQFITLDTMPLTPNGKIDRKALANYTNQMDSGVKYVAPGNIVEKKLAEIWEQILGVEKVGLNDNFFDLGGHSLKATNLISRIYKEFQVQIPLNVIFTQLNLKELATYIQESDETSYAAIQSLEKQNYYLVSSSQRRLYIVQNQLDEDNTSYNIPRFIQVKGELDQVKLNSTLQQLIQRHEPLRTSFHLKEGEVVQKIHDTVSIEVQNYSASDVNQLSEMIQPFNLEEAPLLRVNVIKTAEEKILMFDIHHIICDGTSMELLVDEFIRLYKNDILQDLTVQYKDFATWQNQFYESERMSKQEEYWLQQFADEVPLLNLPTDYSRSYAMGMKGSKEHVKLGKELTDQLNKLTSDHNVTLYMVLLSAYSILLSKYSGQKDIVVGTPLAGRIHPDTEKMIGMFVNTLAMRNYPKSELTFLDFLSELKEATLQRFENQEYQFEMLVEKLNLDRDVSRNPLFDVMLAVQNINFAEEDIADIDFAPYPLENNVTKFDLNLHVIPRDELLHFSLNYRSGLFKAETIKRLLEHFENILQQIVTNPRIQLKDIQFLSEQEKNQLLIEFNDTSRDEGRDHQPVQILFEEQVAITPENIAFVYGEEKYTYHELNGKANQLARLLREKGVKPNQIVGLIANRSADMAVGILAILKAGGAFLPIDPAYPEDRIKYLLEDSNVNLVLKKVDNNINDFFSGEILDLDDQGNYTGDDENLEQVNSSEDLCHVIYTSGSTGLPKGVLVEHRAVVNYSDCIIEKAQISEEDISLFLLSYSFDGSYTNFWPAFLGGATLAIISDLEYNDPKLIMEYIAKHQVTFIKITPSLFNMLIGSQSFEQGHNLSSVRMFVFGGEEIRIKDLVTYHQKYPNVTFMNHYGPTEATIGCLSRVIDVIDLADYIQKPVIGKPHTNMRAYIFSPDQQLQPIGVPGELYVAGKGLARGYLNRPELTEERFISNPVIPSEKIYKTGDLTRWTSTGEVEYLGRIDNQIKIRGYRVELGEIENRLLRHEALEEVVVIDKTDDCGNKYLCVYLVGEDSLSTMEIRKFLSDTLPQYMIPSHYVWIDQIPLRPSGKIDYAQLPEPNTDLNTGFSYVAPQTETQQKLATLWSQLLNVERVGIEDHFFELGGHSLTATHLVSKIFKEFQIELPLRAIFKSPTIRELADTIDNINKQEFYSIKRIENQPYYPVSSAQKRIFMVEQVNEPNLVYNMLKIITIKGEINLDHFEYAFQKLVNRHEGFRTSFEIKDGQIVQVIHDNVQLRIEYGQGKMADLDAEIQKFVKPFDLSQAPLIRVKLVELEDRHLLLLDTHHIIFDGVSTGILIKEFATLYQGKEVPKLDIQYKDYSAWQLEQLNSGTIKKQEEYWMNQLADYSPLDIATDFSRPEVMGTGGDKIRTTLTRELTDQLKELAMTEKTTLHVIMMATYNLLLSNYTDQSDLIVGLPVAGRTHADLENVIGMFINMLPFRNYVDKDITFSDFLQMVHENALDAYNNQDYPFDLLAEKLGIERDPGRNPLFDTIFILQNTGSNQALQLNDVTLESYQYDRNVSRFDLTFGAVEQEKGIQIEVEYRDDLFYQGTIERMLNHYIHLLKMVVAGSATKIRDLQLLNDQEKQQLLYDFNDTQAEYPDRKTVTQIFEEQVALNPDGVAVTYGSQTLTYTELNARANQLARHLRERGVGKGIIVGLMFERSLEMIAAIIGVIKAGGAYLPIDPNYPQDRIEYMLKDSGTKYLITSESWNQISFEGEKIDLSMEEVLNQSTENLELVNQPNDLLYIIYTSGSTGKPKGVMIEHVNVVRLLYNSKMQFDFTSQDVWTMFHSYCFDFSVWEVYGALLYGGKLVVTSKVVAQDPTQFAQLLRDEKVTVLNQTPTAFDVLSNEEMKIENNDLAIHYIIFGGEALKPMKLKNWQNKYPQTKLINMYGITETTVHVTFKEIGEGEKEIDTNISNIGVPIPTLTTYIMDEDLQLKPLGVPGELCVGGLGVARGYLNRPELTEERFVENPYIPGERIYRSGDLARMLPNGEMEYLGRIDHQVKIRGFRIELGEIESRLLSHPDIKEATVLGREDGDSMKYLCAYIVQVNEVTIADLRNYLLETLPDYMVPAYFIILDQMPITSNGKIDRKALLQMQVSVKVDETEYVAPQSEAEEKLAQIWAEVLEVEQVGLNDNFFSLGGDSIKAIQILSKANDQDIRLTVKEIFNYQTIREIMNNVDYNRKNEISQEEVVGDVLFTPIQQHFFEKNLEYASYYNQTNLFKLPDDVDLERLGKAFQIMIDHHDGLRMTFKEKEGQVTQCNRPKNEVEFRLEHVDLAHESAETRSKKLTEISEEVQSKVNLERDLLIKGVVFDLGDGGKRLLIAIHHLIIDGVSWRILLENIEHLYQSPSENKLPLKTTSYQEWAQRLHTYANETELDIDYWEQLKTKEIRPLASVDEKEVHYKDYQACTVTLDQKHTEKLLTEVHWTYNTQIDDLLLTALTMAFTEVMNTSNLLISLESHGREEILEGVDLSRTIGWFTSIYPVYLERKADISQTIKFVKENLRKIPDNGIHYEIARYMQKNEKLRGLNPEIEFNYLGQFDNTIKGESQSLFSVCPEDKGKSIDIRNQNYALLIINCVIIQGQLQVTLKYAPNYLPTEKMTQFQQELIKQLTNIIDHCLNKDEQSLTASDFGVEKLVAEDDFDYIANLYDL